MKIVNLLIFVFGVSHELEFKISHGNTGYLFVIGAKSFKCSLQLDHVAIQACTESGYSKSDFIGNENEYIQFVNNHPELEGIQKSRFFTDLTKGDYKCTEKVSNRQECTDERGDNDDDCHYFKDITLGSNCLNSALENRLFIHCSGEQSPANQWIGFTENQCKKFPGTVEVQVQTATSICARDCDYCQIEKDFTDFNQVFNRGVRPDPAIDIDVERINNCTIKMDYVGLNADFTEQEASLDLTRPDDGAETNDSAYTSFLCVSLLLLLLL